MSVWYCPCKTVCDKHIGIGNPGTFRISFVSGSYFSYLWSNGYSQFLLYRSLRSTALASDGKSQFSSRQSANNIFFSNISPGHKGKKQLFRKARSVQKGWSEAPLFRKPVTQRIKGIIVDFQILNATRTYILLE